ncbi:MAG: hypothetical protein HRT77_11690 [Halioglobus sp.]|nr:hypothetical protein [Halioglobus sp.]
MWQSGDVLFLIAQISQHSIESLPRLIGHDVLVFDTRDDVGRATAATENLNVDIA